MDYFLIIVAFGFIIALWNRINKLKDKVEHQDRIIFLLQKELDKREAPDSLKTPPISKEKIPVPEIKTKTVGEKLDLSHLKPAHEEVKPIEIVKRPSEIVNYTIPSTALTASKTQSTKQKDSDDTLRKQREIEVKRREADEKAKAEKQAIRRARWSVWEKRFAENWTGILGSLAMVLGVGFLGIYAALKLTAFFRFLIISGLSAALFGSFAYFKRQQTMAQLGHWLGSAGAAVFLFGCFGSTAIPGLLWVESDITGLTLILAGIIVNFAFTFIAATQLFASLHAILCMAVLSIIPMDKTMAIATLVTLGNILFTYRYRWDKHLLITLSAFFVFFMIWRWQSDMHELSSRISSIACVIVVGVSAALIHYRKDYASERLETLPFLTHVANWLFTGGMLISLSMGNPWTTIPLAAACLASYFLARYGRKVGVLWVYRTDTLLSQFVALLTVYSLHRWEMHTTAIAALLTIESYFFAVLMFKEGDSLLSLIGMRIAQIALALFVVLLIFPWKIFYIPNETEILLTLVVIFFCTAIYQKFFVHKFGESKDAFFTSDEIAVSLTGIIAPLMWIACITHGTAWGKGYYVAALGLSLTMFTQYFTKTRGIALGAQIANIAISILIIRAFTHPDNTKHSFIALSVLSVAQQIYFLLMHRAAITFFTRFNRFMMHFLFLMVWVFSLFAMHRFGQTFHIWFMVVISGSICAASMYHWFVVRHLGEETDTILYDLKKAISGIGFIMPLFSIAFFWALYSFSWMAIIGILILVLFMGKLFTVKSRGLEVGIALASVIFALNLVATVLHANVTLKTIEIATLVILFISFLAYHILISIKAIAQVNGFNKFTAVVLQFCLCLTAFILSIHFETTSLLTAAFILGVSSVVAFTYHLIVTQKYTERFDALDEKTSNVASSISVFGVLAGIMPSMLFIMLRGSWWMETCFLISMIFLLFIRKKYDLFGAGMGLLTSMCIILIHHWYSLLWITDNTLGMFFWKNVPLTILLVFAFFWSQIRSIQKSIRPFMIYLIGAHLIFTFYNIGSVVSPLLPGIAALLTSLIFMESATRSVHRDAPPNGHQAKYLYHAAYIFALIFIIEFIRIDLQIESYIGFIQTRDFIGFLAIGSFIYSFFVLPTATAPTYKSMTHLKPIYLELAIGVGTTLLMISMESVYFAPLWAVVAIGFVIIAQKGSPMIRRLEFYAVIYAWVSGIYLAAMTSTMEVPSLEWYVQPWLQGTIALILQTTFLVLIHRTDFLQSVFFPPPLKSLESLYNAIKARQHLWMYYPFFITTAIFLYWRFESAILTLLWVLECFVIFGLSLFLRISQFRIVALMALSACIVRLIFFDMANTETIMRGIVFLGVGLLMVGMNYIYRRFKEESPQ